MIEEHSISVRQACKQVELPRSSFLYIPQEKDDEPIIDELNRLVSKHTDIGFWMCYYRLRRKNFPWNHKRVYRIYKAMHLNIKRRTKKRLPARAKQHLFQPSKSNQVWSMDFMSDSLWNGRKYRLLNVIDDYNRQVLYIETDTSIPSSRVIRTLERIKEERGLPEMIRVDNGPEFISKKLDEWCRQNNIELAFIQPGKPTQNTYIERLNGSLRRELLNAYIFKTIGEVREKAYEWMIDYNENRPHKAFKYKAPLDLL